MVYKTNPVVPLASWMVNPLTSADIITTSDEEFPGFCNVIGTTSLNLKDFWSIPYMGRARAGGAALAPRALRALFFPISFAKFFF